MIVVHESLVCPEQLNYLLFFRKILQVPQILWFFSIFVHLNPFQQWLYDFEIHIFTLRTTEGLICNYYRRFKRSLGAFPLQICAKLWRYFINVDKKVLRNDGISINQCYATKTYPFASRDKSWQRILVRFDRFLIYLFKGGVSVHLYRSSTESHFRNMRGVAGINTSID